MSMRTLLTELLGLTGLLTTLVVWTVLARGIGL